MKGDFAIYSRRVVLPDGIVPATIFVKNGKIVRIIEGKVVNAECPLESVGKQVLMPGCIDAHVHINEPGRTEWEGFDTATRAAAAGGITSLVDMPLNSDPVTTTADDFVEKINATSGKLHVNCGFWGGLVPGNADELEGMIKMGVLGIKAFLSHSGIDDFQNVLRHDLNEGMPIIAAYDLPLLVHCEIEDLDRDNSRLEKNPTSYKAYLKSRPKSWENKAVELMVELCEKHNCKTHIVHISSAKALPTIWAAKSAQLPLTVETCPHYLYFCAEEIPDGNTLFKCAPPIRGQKNNEQLWQALNDDLIDYIATDHSPAPPDLKEIESGNLLKAWGGISSLQFLLPIIWTSSKKRGHGFEDIVNWLSDRPAQLAGLKTKGKIAVGYDADFVVWNPEEEFTVTKEMIEHRHKVSPYIGERLFGKVTQTYVDGIKVFEDGEMLHLNKGNLLLKKQSGIDKTIVEEVYK